MISLDVSCPNNCNGCDNLKIALRSLSLRKIGPDGLPLRNAHGRTPKQFQELDVNHTLKAVHIECCPIGAEGLALLSCFQGIETMCFVRVDVKPDAAEQVTQLFSRFHALKELQCYENVDWVENALRAAPTLRKVTVDFGVSENQHYSHSCLRNIMVACSAALTIRFRHKHLIDILCAGLEDATSLTDLTLSLRYTNYDMSDTAAILESLQRNSSLVRVALERNFVSLTANEATKSFLEVKSLLEYIRTLRRNGSLKFLSLHPGKDILRKAHILYNVDSSISGEIEQLLLNCNTTLQQIDSVDCEHRIGRLLVLNRYGEDFVATATSVPMEDWGDVLMRIGKEECNFFVTELVRRAVNG